jgi:hypothetical protein
MPLFLTFIAFNIHSYNAILFYLHRFSALEEKPPWGAEPKIELGPVLQQADALPTAN